MKKIYFYLFVLFILIIFPNNVKAYTTGTIKGYWSSSNNYYTGQRYGSTGMNTISVPVQEPVLIQCDTAYCFASFEYISTATQEIYYDGVGSSQTVVIDQDTYIQIYNGKWSPCESANGVATCMMANNTSIWSVEIKYYQNTGTSYSYHFDLNSGTIFNSPTNPEAMITNFQQQQQQQNQIINNTDTTSNSNDFLNTINNFNIPNDSHSFDILGGLQNFVGGLSVSSSCRRISIPVPFTNQNVTLPCMTTDVYSVHFPEIVVIWQLLVRGLVYYYIIVNFLKLLKETIDPFSMKLEVLDL